jgi:hypothetical protein
MRMMRSMISKGIPDLNQQVHGSVYSRVRED